MDGDHYFSADPSSPSQPRSVRLTLEDLTLDLVTDGGVFSPGRIDPGTKVLLSAVPPADPHARELVDLGAGYGPVALTMAQRHPEARVWAVEPNRRAADLCALNAARAGLDNVVVVSGAADLPPDLEVDALWSNPPIRIGKKALHSLLDEWLGRLRPGGSAWLVVGKHLGADSLARWLDTSGWSTRRVASRQTYRVLEVSSRGKPDVD
jgi:16S rRNA (guanine1207-N2)-methyltransferase